MKSASRPKVASGSERNVDLKAGIADILPEQPGRIVSYSARHCNHYLQRVRCPQSDCNGGVPNFRAGPNIRDFAVLELERRKEGCRLVTIKSACRK